MRIADRTSAAAWLTVLITGICVLISFLLPTDDDFQDEAVRIRPICDEPGCRRAAVYMRLDHGSKGRFSCREHRENMLRDRPLTEGPSIDDLHENAERKIVTDLFGREQAFDPAWTKEIAAERLKLAQEQGVPIDRTDPPLGPDGIKAKYAKMEIADTRPYIVPRESV